MNAVLMSPSSHSHGSDDDCSDCPPHGEVCVEQWVPLIKAAAAFAKSKLWMPEVRTDKHLARPDPTQVGQ